MQQLIHPPSHRKVNRNRIRAASKNTKKRNTQRTRTIHNDTVAPDAIRVQDGPITVDQNDESSAIQQLVQQLASMESRMTDWMQTMEWKMNLSSSVAQPHSMRSVTHGTGAGVAGYHGPLDAPWLVSDLGPIQDGWKSGGKNNRRLHCELERRVEDSGKNGMEKLSTELKDIEVELGERK